MFPFILGLAVGSFMAAFINYRYNTSSWIKTKYLVWIGIITLILSVILGWPDIQKKFKDGDEAESELTARLIL